VSVEGWVGRSQKKKGRTGRCEISDEGLKILQKSRPSR
jgi:hypothetical protein